MVVKPKHLRAGNFHDGLAVVENKKGKRGYIDKKGKVVIKQKYDWAEDFNNGLALVKQGPDEARKMAYIDKQGKHVWREK